MPISPPEIGYVCWPVGNRDSTRVFIDDGVVMQVDVNHLECSAEHGDPHVPIIDELIEILPEVDGKPYLSLFALTHCDQDHCRGLTRLLQIGALSASPFLGRGPAGPGVESGPPVYAP